MSHIMSTLDDVERGIVARFEEVSSRFEDWDEDNVQNLKHLNEKIKKMLQPPSTTVPPQVVNQPQGTFALCVDTPILGTNGAEVGCLGQLMHELTLLRDENVDIRAGQVKMREELDAIKADVTAQGGVMLGHHTFSSEIQVMQIAMKECPQGDAFALFVDPVSIYCHDAMYSPVVGWEKTTKAMEESGVMSVTDRKVVASYNCNHAFWFTDGKPVVAGKVIGAFASAEKWTGTGGMDGRRVEIETSLTAGDCVRTGIADKLPAGSKLAQLATKMLEHTQSWLSKVNKHLDSELTKLTQMNISPEEALILLSEEVIIMFDRFYTIRRKRMEFIVKGTRVQYMVRCIWLTMQVHMAMDEFVRDGMKCNPAISAAFVRFLTKQTGSNVGAGIGVMISKLESRLHAAEAAAKEALQTAKEASKRATGASTAADTCKTALAKINTIKK
jgi:hypothetical protein